LIGLTRNWSHRIRGGKTSVAFQLRDGTSIAGESISGVLNRLSRIPDSWAAGFIENDRAYVREEMWSFHLSWLASLRCPVINRPTPQGLSGAWRHAAQWAVLASRAGFSVPVYRQCGKDPIQRGYGPLMPRAAHARTVVVLDREVFGAAMPEGCRLSCVSLARQAEVRMLGIDLVLAKNGEATFVKAHILPDLRIGGSALVERLQGIFQRGAAR
jgi:hypothetical protein